MMWRRLALSGVAVSMLAGCGSGGGANHAGQLVTDGAPAGADAPGQPVTDGAPAGVDTARGLSLEELMDPATCEGCHPQQYRTWVGSMHAYAAENPLFKALNRRGQREANLGDFCLRCHAPIALQLGLTTDGSNLDDVPQKYKGVTCYFCHSVADVQGTHDNPVVLSGDGVMLGQFSDPAPTYAHASGYSAWLDRDRWNSSTLCGSCHDIKTGAGTIERVYQEWTQSVFAQAPGGATCSQCHMDQSAAPQPGASDLTSPLRRLHDHGYPAVGVALTPFTGADTQRAQIQALLDSTLQSALCVCGQGKTASLEVVLDNVASGHAWPSGAAMIRHGWVELKAYVGSQLIYQSGVVPDGTPIATLGDPDLWLIRDCMLDDQNHEVMPWAATKFESSVLPAQLTFDRNDSRFYQSHVYEIFPHAPPASSGGNVDGGTALDATAPDSQGGLFLPAMPDRVDMRVRLESVALGFIDSLIASGDLDPTFRDKIPVFNLGGDAPLEWTPATANEIFLDEIGTPVSCISKTNLKAQAGKVRASQLSHCKP